MYGTSFLSHSSFFVRFAVRLLMVLTYLTTERCGFMPLRIQADLPAIEVLESENIFVMTHEPGADPGYPALKNCHSEFDAHKN